ncbi:hypothetical protein BGW38_004983, partial [Lunasporangiospora selenospora]
MAQERTDSELSANNTSDILWIKTAVDRSPNAFFDAFTLNDKKLAHQRYLRMVKDCNLSPTTKKNLLLNFETWKTDHGPVFWLDRRTQSSQIRTAATLVEGSEPYADQSIHRNVTRQRNTVAKSGDVSASFSTSLNSNGVGCIMAQDKIVDVDETGIPGHFSQLSNSADALMPTTAAVISSSDCPPAEKTTTPPDPSPVETELESTELSGVNENEKADLLANLEQACHNECEWKVNGCCVACLFQNYQKICVQALVENQIKKSEIADIMAITGIFAPFLPTERMIKSIKRSILEELIDEVTCPEPFLDDAAVVRAVRLWISNKREEASEVLRGLDRKLRIMFETLLEQVPMKEDRSVSEETFVVNYVAPILHGVLRTDSRFSLHFPNTASEVQKHQGLKPDRPDIVVKVRGREVLYGEVTGLFQGNADWKNKWDLFRLARFGKAFLDEGNDVAPLLQIVYSNGTFLRLTVK